MKNMADRLQILSRERIVEELNNRGEIDYDLLIDGDGDGKMDVVVNGKNADFLRQIKAENGKYYFKNLGPMDGARLSNHSTSPTPVDFNADGVPDLVIGAEDGRLYYLRNPRSEKESEE